MNMKLLKKPLAPLAFLAAGILLTASTPAQAHWGSPNLVQRLERDGRFTTLLTALEITGLKDTVAAGGVFTLFAPTDEAFAAIPTDTLAALIADPPALANILLYHVAAGRETTGALLNDSTATTLQGNPVLVLRERWQVLVNGQPVVSRSIWAGNGIIHPVGGVLLPPSSPININSLVDVLALDGRFTTLIAAVQAAGLADTLVNGGPFTVFAPTDDAFNALPPGTVDNLLANPDQLQDVLLYHVLGEKKSALRLLVSKDITTLQGSEVDVKVRRGSFYVNESKILNPNVNAPNGIIQVIDAVLLPPAAAPNLLELLQNDGRFATLVTALQLTGLDGVVATGGPLTIFAPTDDAFEALPDGTVDALIADPEALKAVLLYHVVSGDKSAKQLLRERRIETLQGANVWVYRWWNRVFVNRSLVIDADLEASNGRVHAIRNVLLPPTN
jgi:uncharacterized surface protein with fasciclin (FAS1) repeats